MYLCNVPCSARPSSPLSSTFSHHLHRTGRPGLYARTPTSHRCDRLVDPWSARGYKDAVARETGHDVPAGSACAFVVLDRFRCFHLNESRARDLPPLHDISESWGTAVNDGRRWCSAIWAHLATALAFTPIPRRGSNCTGIPDTRRGEDWSPSIRTPQDITEFPQGILLRQGID